jgi:alanyl-tRNA synthetase
MQSVAQIREAFISFFEKHGHARVASSPLVPHNDPSLMFTNAGMVPFKNVFTGQESRPYTRAVSCQKCVRAGGKHNDLDNVGYTARHHTFFEMLGNFSFGDYFKEEAISLAWELVTKIFAIAPERLVVTVYHTDDEAFSLWRRIAGIPEERIIRIKTQDNFWSMGETGPCGPCSEIFYDHGPHVAGGPPGSADEDGDRFVEIWNLVFMQFDRQADGTLVPLPKPSIDTGMGLERVSAVMQGKHDNYEIDLMRALIDSSVKLSGNNEVTHFHSHRVIADHVRASGFLLADGVLPANEGRGYVLRRIMRRAMRHVHLLGAKEPLLYRIAPTLLNYMGDAYPELKRAEALIVESLRGEEVRFRETLGRGLKLLDEETSQLDAGGKLPGAVAFKLYDTFGFPLDLTEDILRARKMSVDNFGFDAAMAEQKSRARAAWSGSGDAKESPIWFALHEKLPATEFLGYSAVQAQGNVVALLVDGAEVNNAKQGDSVDVILNQTPFYGESGGQEGDRGALFCNNTQLEVLDTQKKIGGLIVHRCKVEVGVIKINDSVNAVVDNERRLRVRANHSATHLLHAALRKVLGAHVTQKGSLVSAERLRFDFSHNTTLSSLERRQIENLVNAEIRSNRSAQTKIMSIDEAMKIGAMALFGEKYDDEVRVVSMGSEQQAEHSFSVELCGGTHVAATGDIGVFVIQSEASIAAGVRRIEALTGEAALAFLLNAQDLLNRAAESLKTSAEQVQMRIENLQEERKRLERTLAEAQKNLALGGTGNSTEAEKIGDISFIGAALAGLPAKELRSTATEIRQKIGSGIVAVGTVEEGKASLIVAVSADLLERFSAVKLLEPAAALLGGRGGGKPDFAQAGGPAGDLLADAIDKIRQAIL